MQVINVPDPVQTKITNFGRSIKTQNMWTLPSAQQQGGAMLVLPVDIGMYEEVISRWESITKNVMDDPAKAWPNSRSKMDYIENLLGEDEKKIWIQWRMAYPSEYDELTNIADDTQNITSQIRRIFLLQDPYQGSQQEQERAYLDLERLQCNEVKVIFNYLNDFKHLAAKSGQMFISPELSEKLFRKMPQVIGKELESTFNEKNPGATIGVMPRIHFSYQYLAEMYKKAAL